ncbi:MAG: sulfopyruvate decarboxylase subunit alpha [Euryarchaeota archaeon]|nr:MAG: Sulfopyruvate decarboxylase subunit alpha [ANME-2 cluster archaeon]MEA1864472.1 sulfopyruvate decarboxylase subunit alpha [Euryarchaeota archaeon]
MNAYLALKEAGIDFVASVPCVNLGELIDMIESDDEIIHIPVTREEEGIGICAGAYFGGKNPALVMQNSGLGNSINALASLNLLYGIPLLMIISHRGDLGEQISAQVPMGQLTPKLLDDLGVPWYTPTPSEIGGVISGAWTLARTSGLPVAILLGCAFWSGSGRASDAQ